MREIKFRAWDEIEKQMYPKKNITIGINVGYDLSVYKDGFILEQYTGLKDKNGKEIYEGDIFNNIHKEICVVVFYEGMYFEKRVIDTFEEFLRKDVNTYEECMSFLMPCRTEDIEIIGNIHENPELLK